MAWNVNASVGVDAYVVLTWDHLRVICVRSAVRGDRFGPRSPLASDAVLLLAGTIATLCGSLEAVIWLGYV